MTEYANGFGLGFIVGFGWCVLLVAWSRRTYRSRGWWRWSLRHPIKTAQMEWAWLRRRRAP